MIPGIPTAVDQILHISATAPAAAYENMLWLDVTSTVNPKWKVYLDGAWRAVEVGATAPSVGVSMEQALVRTIARTVATSAAVEVGATAPSVTDGDPASASGIFAYLGTNDGAEAFSNPAYRTAGAGGYFPLLSAALDDHRRGEKASDHAAVLNSDEVHTTAVANSWWRADFGHERQFTVTHYAIYGREGTDQFTASFIRNWKLQGSNDAATWTDLDTRTSDTSVGDGVWGDWAVAGASAHRFLRILQTGLNNSGENHLVMGEVELWGSISSRDYGGTEVGAGGTEEVFTAGGTWDWSAAGSPTNVDVLIVGGGGGGGGNRGAGGGAGGVVEILGLPVSGDMAVTVGAGGTAGTSIISTSRGGDGAASYFGDHFAYGGGGGGGNTGNRNGLPGGSGGGGGHNTSGVGRHGAYQQGNRGGDNDGGNSGAGGGGAGAAGSDAAGNNGGAGGAGVTLWSRTVGGGGGGGGYSGTGGAGGSGGGGDGASETGAVAPQAGVANTGGGGGGGTANASIRPGAAGGSGLVVVRY